MEGKEKNQGKDTVILLHGIALSKRTLLPIKHYLQQCGYDTLAITYPSRKMTLDDLAEWLASLYLTPEFWTNHAGKVHFVTHSMGGLLARRYLSLYKTILPTDKIGKMVMLGTPNKGSELADFLEKFFLYRWIFGPAGQELTTSTQETNSDFPYYDTGIIAGSEGWLYPLSSLFFPGLHDGRVAVERTKLDGMRDHLVCKTSHTMMIYRPYIWEQTAHFLKHGVFNHDV